MARISCARDAAGDSERQLSAFWDLVGVLSKDGHILGQDYWPLRLPDEWALYAFVPAADALAESTWNSYITERIEKLAELSMSRPEITILGNAVDVPSACKCLDSSWLVLQTDSLEIDSPVKCGDCIHPIPLYRLPRPEHNEFYEVLCWASDYKSCEKLWLNSSTGERLGTHELSWVDSSLSKRGMKICAELEAKVGKPVYYYLWRHYGSGTKFEKQRKCPKCGGEWRLEEPLHRLLHFRCDKCRIVSTIAV